MNSRPKKTPDTGSNLRNSSSFELATARRMLPLVRSIVADIVLCHQQLGSLEREQDYLDRHKRDLSWTERRRRYVVQEDLAKLATDLNRARTELSALGVKLIDEANGTIEFPTRIQGRPAAFRWQIGQEAVNQWHYEEEDVQRPIPSEWQSGVPARKANT